jgi:hypothetical protein
MNIGSPDEKQFCKLEPPGFHFNNVAVVETHGSDLAALGPKLEAFTQMAIVVGDDYARCRLAESRDYVVLGRADLDSGHLFRSGFFRCGRFGYDRRWRRAESY